MSEYIGLFEKNFPFWNYLNENEKKQFCDNTFLNKYQKGETIHDNAEGCLGLLYIKSGQLRVYILSDDGREITLYRLFKDDVCVLSASCVLESITFDVFIDAEEDTELLQLSSRVFHSMSEKNLHLKCYSYELTTARFSDVMWAMQQILFMSADKRLAVFLVDEISKNGTDYLSITHDQIARFIGSAREVVSRLLKYFEQEGIVALSRGKIYIKDKKKLRELTL